MKCRQTLSMLIASCLLAGCATSTTLALPPMPQAERCLPLPLLASDADMGTMVLDDVTIAGLYAECARRNAAWVEWSQKAKTVSKD